MYVDHLKRNLLKQVLYSGIIVAALAGSYVLFDEKSTQLKEELRKHQSEIQQQKQKIETLLLQQKDFRESAKLWEQLSDDSKKLEGLRIEEGRLLLEELKDDYKLGSLDIKVTPPTELSGAYKTETSTIMSSKVNLSYTAISDQYALSFLDALLTRMPGYIQISNFSIRRDSDFSAAIIESIYNGQLPALVSVSLEFQWQDLKSTATTHIEAPGTEDKSKATNVNAESTLPSPSPAPSGNEGSNPNPTAPTSDASTSDNTVKNTEIENNAAPE